MSSLLPIFSFYPFIYQLPSSKVSFASILSIHPFITYFLPTVSSSLHQEMISSFIPFSSLFIPSIHHFFTLSLGTEVCSGSKLMTWHSNPPILPNVSLDSEILVEFLLLILLKCVCIMYQDIFTIFSIVFPTNKLNLNCPSGFCHLHFSISMVSLGQISTSTLPSASSLQSQRWLGNIYCIP